MLSSSCTPTDGNYPIYDKLSDYQKKQLGNGSVSSDACSEHNNVIENITVNLYCSEGKLESVAGGVLASNINYSSAYPAHTTYLHPSIGKGLGAHSSHSLCHQQQQVSVPDHYQLPRSLLQLPTVNQHNGAPTHLLSIPKPMAGSSPVVRAHKFKPLSIIVSQARPFTPRLCQLSSINSSY